MKEWMKGNAGKATQNPNWHVSLWIEHGRFHKLSKRQAWWALGWDIQEKSTWRIPKAPTEVKGEDFCPEWCSIWCWWLSGQHFFFWCCTMLGVTGLLEVLFWVRYKTEALISEAHYSSFSLICHSIVVLTPTWWPNSNATMSCLAIPLLFQLQLDTVFFPSCPNVLLF